VAIGTTIEITSGAAAVYAGFPQGASHRLLATISAGESYQVNGLAEGEVISVQGGSAFGYEVVLGNGTVPDPEDPPGQDPNLMYSIPSLWVCNIPQCTTGAWTGQVINWPSWSAYSSNARAGDLSRSVYAAADGTLLTPYMGSWANGCEITTHSGQALIIEWERGTDVWRETYVDAGETYVIQLASPENGVLIETNDFNGNFSISVSNCTPQPLQ
jgi:hypothetical protein